MKTLNKMQLAVGTLAVVVALGACKRTEQRAESTTTSSAMMTKTDSALRTGVGDTVGLTSMTLTDSEILAMLDEVNEGEVELGEIARDKATNAEVKAFAREMVAAHKKMESEADALAKRLNISPKSAASDSLAMMNKAAEKAQESMAKGPAYDTAYVNSQVVGHEKALAFLKRASAQAMNPELKSLLVAAEAPVQQHLDQARMLRTKLK